MAMPNAPTSIAWHQLWLLALRHRPLLWIAPAIALGCTLGPRYAILCGATTRASLLPWLPLMPALGCAFYAYRSWRCGHADRVRVALFGFLLALCVMRSAQRVLPPATDLSALLRVPLPTGPQQRVAARLEGYVADFPAMNDFGVSFPLQCRRIATGQNVQSQLRGRVWVDAPLDANLEVGDKVALQADLADLPRAGNPAERAPELRFIADNCWCRAKVKHAHDLHLLQRAAGYPLERWIAGMRRRLLAHYEAAFGGATGPMVARPYPHATAQLLSAMVFGQGGLQKPLPPLIRDQFRAAGLAHTLVASGTQVACLMLFLLGAIRILGLRRWWVVVVFLPTLLLYALLTGGGPSIWRATIAGVCISWALLLGRDLDKLALWSLALALILLLDPMQLFSIGLQITFAATWGIIALTPVVNHLLKRFWGTTRGSEFLAFSLGAQLATIPLLLYHFGRLSAAGLGASFVVLPLAGFLVGTGILGLAVPIVNTFNYSLTRLIANIAAFAAATPGTHTATTPVNLKWIISFYGLLLLIAALPSFDYGAIARYELQVWWQRRWQGLVGLRPQGVVVAGALVVTIIMAWHTATTHSPWLRVTLLDVGQGESIVVRAPSGRTLLIDSGSLDDERRGEVGRTVIVPYLQSLGITKLDAIVMTHADADHCNAFASIMAELPVGLAVDGGMATDPTPRHEPLGYATPRNAAAKPTRQPAHGGANADAGHGEYKQLKQLLRKRGVPIYPARAGQHFSLGDGITLTVLAPLQPPFTSDNNNGAVLRLDYGTTSLLLTADIERAAEERLVRRGAPLRCTILKLAHHGSKTSTSLPLLNAAHPQAAILSCGRYNGFGHPSPQTLDRLAQRGVPVFRTDANGALEVFSDGHACWIQTFR